MGMDSSATAPPCQMIRRPAIRCWSSMDRTISVMTARISCLRSGMVVVGA